MFIFEIEINEENAICTALVLAYSKDEGVKILEKAGFNIAFDRNGKIAATTILEDQIGDRIVFSITEHIYTDDNDMDKLSSKIAKTYYKSVNSRIDGSAKSEVDYKIIGNYKIKFDSEQELWMLSVHVPVRSGEYHHPNDYCDEDQAIEHAHMGQLGCE